jgi:hypothetical protein
VTHPEVAPQQRSSAATNLNGKKVSLYRVLEILSGGGMGLVYRAEDIKFGRHKPVYYPVSRDSLPGPHFINP